MVVFPLPKDSSEFTEGIRFSRVLMETIFAFVSFFFFCSTIDSIESIECKSVLNFHCFFNHYRFS